MRSEKVIGIVTEPVTLAEARRHCRIDADSSDGHPDDAMLELYISAARGYAENFTGLAFGKKTLELGLDDFEDIIELTAPATSVTSVSYYLDDVLTAIDAENYILDDFGQPSYLLPVTGFSWPTPDVRPNAVRIVYVTGYGTDSDSEPIPFEAKAAILLTVGHLYENREDVTDKPLSSIPNGAEALLRPLRVRLGMA